MLFPVIPSRLNSDALLPNHSILRHQSKNESVPSIWEKRTDQNSHRTSLLEDLKNLEAHRINVTKKINLQNYSQEDFNKQLTINIRIAEIYAALKALPLPSRL